MVDTFEDNLHLINLAMESMQERTMLNVPIDRTISDSQQIALIGAGSGLWKSETQPNVTPCGDRCGACGQQGTVHEAAAGLTSLIRLRMDGRQPTWG